MDSESPPSDSKKFQRSYKACLNCRVRKVKCNGWEAGRACDRCTRERKECVFAESKRGGRTNVVKGKKRKAELEAEHHKKIPSDASLNQLWPQEVQQRFMDPASNGNSNGSISYAKSPVAPFVPDANNGVRKLPPPTALLKTEKGDVLNPYTRRMLSMEDQSRNKNDLPSLQEYALNEQLGPEQQQETSQNSPPQSYQNSETSRIDGESAPLDTASTGALAFLAKAAGNIARADQRDRIDAYDRHMVIQNENASRLHSHAASDASLTSVSSGKQRKESLPKSNVSSEVSTPDVGQQEKNFSIPPIMRANSVGSRIAMPAAEDPQSVRPKPSTKLKDTEYIGEHSILTESAARKFIHLFFSTMHPFFPHIPPNLMDPDTLAGYPILLCAILTISSRYHALDELEDEDFQEQVDSTPRHIEIHERLWVYCQRLISQTVWAEASTRSIGTVFAFLLFTEWNPRAIHWRWSDYANADDPSKPQGLDTSDEGVTGLGAMRRSARMSWMLIGSAVRLAQDMGFMDNSSRIFLACHISETFSAMNVNKRSMLSTSLSEIDLDSDDEEEEQIPVQQPPRPKRRSKNKEADEIDMVMEGDEENLRLKTDTKLRFSRMQKAKIELLQIMSICYETLYGVKPKLDGLGQKQTLAILNILSPLLGSWYKSYKDLLVVNTGNNTSASRPITAHSQQMLRPPSKYTKDIGRLVDTESLLFDYHYAKLYIYSLALADLRNQQVQTSKNEKSSRLHLDELSKTSKYVELAFNASKEMLACVQRLHKIKMLKFIPVRWMTRIVRAVAFVVKCCLMMTASQGAQGSSSVMSLSIIPLEEILSIIKRISIALREASPDELHLCTRYSTILAYLCSEIRSKIFNKSTVTVDYEAEVNANELGSQFHSDQQSYETARQFGQESTQAYHEVEKDQQHEQQEQQQQQEASESHTAAPGSSSLPESDQYAYIFPPPQSKESKTTNTTTNDEDIFSFPTDTVFDWFNMDNGGGIGLDFVEPWTAMIEQQLNANKGD